MPTRASRGHSRPGQGSQGQSCAQGTFQRNEDNIRITAQLIDASTGETLWSDRYDRMIGEIFAIQSDVATISPTASAAGPARWARACASVKRKPPSDLGAYETYPAQETMYSDLSPESMRKAQAILEQVIARDPSFARAYVRYANAFAGAPPMKAARGSC